jgi:hypothetical protein
VNLDFTTSETLSKLGVDISDAESGKVKHMPAVNGVLPANVQNAPGAPEGEPQQNNVLGPPPEQTPPPTATPQTPPASPQQEQAPPPQQQ